MKCCEALRDGKLGRGLRLFLLGFFIVNEDSDRCCLNFLREMVVNRLGQRVA